MPHASRSPLTTFVRVALLSGMGAGSLAGQARVTAGIAAQFVSQDGPLGGQSGFGAVLMAGITSPQWIGATLALDFATLRHADRISLCVPVPGGGCLDRPETETITGLGVSLDLQVPTGRVLRPFVGIGPAVRFASGPDQPGGRRRWLTPHVETGVRLAAGGAQWAVSLRWRRVDRWASVKPFTEISFLLGVRRGRHF